MKHHDWIPVEIAGGGLAGLALGVALRRRGIPATVHEAQDYPRHRVCGEFIAGLDDVTSARLELAPLLQDACRHREVLWHRAERPLRMQHLPRPALGISRRTLDLRLAEAFVAAGGDLRTRSRVADDAPEIGRVWATGRRRQEPRWFGLKVHARRLPLRADLEVHLGDRAYVGLSAVEGGWVNVCGLFPRRAPLPPAAPGLARLLQALRDAALPELAGRLTAAELDERSFCAVAALGFEAEATEAGRLCLGDNFAMMPPFTGNGMAVALRSAALAVEPLAAWSRGTLTWDAAVGRVQRALARCFRLRRVSANLLHPFLLEPAWQGWLGAAARMRMLPFNGLYRLTH